MIKTKRNHKNLSFQATYIRGHLTEKGKWFVQNHTGLWAEECPASVPPYTEILNSSASKWNCIYLYGFFYRRIVKYGQRGL